MERDLTYKTMFEDGIYSISVYAGKYFFFDVECQTEDEEDIEEAIQSYLDDNGFGDTYFNIVHK